MSGSQLATILLPEIVLAGTAFAVITLDLLTTGKAGPIRRTGGGTLLASAGVLLSIAMVWLSAPAGHLLQGMVVIDPLTQSLKTGVLLLALGALWAAPDSRLLEHRGEYVALLLFATAGLSLLAGTEHLLMLFIALELSSLCLYLVTAFDKADPRSAEAGLKYLLQGGIASAVTLFGLSLLYGLTNELDLRAIALALGAQAYSPALVAAVVLVIAGFAFKIAAVPFHFWAADTYEAAPLTAAAFIASASKLAGFFILAKTLVSGLPAATGGAGWGSWSPGWEPVCAALAALSMVVGNLAALAQRSVRRLLAYSAVAQAGYMLTGLLAGSRASMSALLYYAFTYGLTVIGAFAVVALVRERTGGDRLSDFAGLSRRSPAAAVAMLVFMLSLAGIPPLAGFIGKFALFAAALNHGGDQRLLWLVALAVLASAVSLYYYLQVLKQIYVASPSADSPERWRIAGPQLALIVVLAILVVVTGCLPELILGPLARAIELARFP